MKTIWSLSVATGLLIAATSADALLVNATLQGDPRATNPDDLVVNVTINTSANIAHWDIDINSPMHPNTKLDKFYFNLSSVLSTDVAFSNFNPTDWEISSPASVQGGGQFTPTFLFQAYDPSGPPKAADVTNLTSLRFDATLVSGSWTLDHFLMAPVSISSDTLLGSGQLGAHLQSLTVNGTTCPSGGCSDSGSVLGVYEEPSTQTSGIPTSASIPTPASSLLLISGLVGLGLMNQRHTNKQRRRVQ